MSVMAFVGVQRKASEKSEEGVVSLSLVLKHALFCVSVCLDILARMTKPC
jgi:hypothetical protein